MNKLTKLLRQDLSYCDPATKKAFHNAGKAALRAVAKEMGLTTDQRDIRANMGGIAVSGEITLHTDKVYVQISQPAFAGGSEVMYRLCDGRKDYCGKQNHFCPAVELENPSRFAARLWALIEGRGDPTKDRWTETMWR